jgi:predicted amidophosphoribosyltransferase
MALIKCPECGTQVSDKAEKCLKCAYPISDKNPLTIEMTAKKLKLQKVFGIFITVIGLVISIYSYNNKVDLILILGILLVLVGVSWYLAVKILIWWYHK